MVKALEQAIERLENLPSSDQEQIGRRLLSHVEKLQQLRQEIDKGIRSLDANGGKQIDVGAFLEEQEAHYEA